MNTQHKPVQLRLFLLRHGESEDNRARLFGGARDTPLSSRGLRQSQAVSQRLSGLTLNAVYTSPAQRARVLADLLCAGRPLTPEVCHDLREVSFGDWEGLSYPEVHERYPGECRRWMEDPLGFAPPKGESFLDVIARVRPLPRRFIDAATHHGRATDGSFHVAVVAHGGVLRALLVRLLASDPSLALRLRFDNAGLSVVDLFGDTATIRCLNDTSHLTEVG
ncbi:MAG: histidine phosphatase family protein [Limnochordia bacterium]|jgi:broad specificity phosphatase PhoE